MQKPPFCWSSKNANMALKVADRAYVLSLVRLHGTGQELLAHDDDARKAYPAHNATRGKRALRKRNAAWLATCCVKRDLNDIPAPTQRRSRVLLSCSELFAGKK